MAESNLIHGRAELEVLNYIYEKAPLILIALIEQGYQTNDHDLVKRACKITALTIIYAPGVLQQAVNEEAIRQKKEEIAAKIPGRNVV